MVHAEGRPETTRWDCVAAVGHSGYSHIFLAPFSLAAVWMVRDARRIAQDAADAADAAPEPDPAIAPTGPALADPPELSPVTAQDDAALTAAHNVTPALAHHSRRFAARQRRLQRAIKTAAADGAGGPDDTERARGAAAWATQGDMISPGPWAVAGGGGGGGGVACGESGSSLIVNSYLHTPFLCPPPCHTPTAR